ncbi:hypothetical protein [Floridanema evergladense]|uniref:HD domain-containing protein n=1 Tax=Floridaenema evergladense BLCC-F167 TaxID=3153639 RepID=A0ABV4WVT2_9CYAN
MKIVEEIPLLEKILGDWKDIIGSQYEPYKNHVYRVINFCLMFHECSQEELEKITIAGSFHDLGIWSNNTVDYLPPSIELAKKYLEESDRTQWSTEIALMIDEHHKITEYADKKYPLVEVFRKADWVDVTMGLRAFDLPKNDVQEIIDKFPNLGFHANLMELTKAEFIRHPFNFLPMMKW